MANEKDGISLTSIPHPRNALRKIARAIREGKLSPARRGRMREAIYREVQAEGGIEMSPFYRGVLLGMEFAERQPPATPEEAEREIAWMLSVRKNYIGVVS